MKSLLTALAVVAACTAPASASTDVPVAHFTVVDDAGHVVGELFAAPGQILRLRTSGNAVAPRSCGVGTAPADGRTAHAEADAALTSDQRTAVWRAQLERVFPPVMAGGG